MWKSSNNYMLTHYSHMQHDYSYLGFQWTNLALRELKGLTPYNSHTNNTSNKQTWPQYYTWQSQQNSIMHMTNDNIIDLTNIYCHLSCEF